MVVFFAWFFTSFSYFLINNFCSEDRCSTMTGLIDRLTITPRMTSLLLTHVVQHHIHHQVSAIKRSMHICLQSVYIIILPDDLKTHFLWQICRSSGCFCSLVHTWQHYESSTISVCSLLKNINPGRRSSDRNTFNDKWTRKRVA